MTALLDTAPVPPGGVEDCSPTELADAIAAARAAEVAAGIEVLKLAVAWADAHPALDDEGRPVPVPVVPGEVLAAHFAGIDPEEHRTFICERPSWAGLPRLAWDAEAGFAVTAGLSTRAGTALLRDALILRHRLPGVWAKVTAGRVPAWRARLIAVEVAGAPDDVCAAIDAVVAPLADKAGTVTVRRLFNEAMVRLYPDVVAVKSWEDLERRYVHLDRDHLSHTAIAGMDIRADYADLVDLDHVLTELAHRLPALDPDARRETLEQRRARALGVLADPARAHQILTQSHDEPTPPTPRRHSTTLVLRISDLALLGVDDAGTIETGPRAGAAVLAETIAAWCARPATDLTVLPVLDMGAHHAGTGYAAPVTLKRHLVERDRHCLFPFCDRPTAACDADQNAPTKSLRGRVVPHGNGGPTCSCNTIPLCRHHHRLKTHAGYTLSLVEPGVVWWTTPWGHHFTVTRDGTVPVTTSAHRAPPRPVCLQ